MSSRIHFSLLLPGLLTVFAGLAAGQLLQVSPSPITFEVQQNGPLPAAQNLSLSSNTGAPLVWSAQIIFGSDILQLSSYNGTTPATVQVGVTRTNLPANFSQAGVIRFTAQGANAVDVQVIVNVSGTGNLNCSPCSLSFVAQSGVTPSPQTFNLFSTTPASFSAAPTAGWLTVSPTSASTPGSNANTTLTVNVLSTGLSSGTHNANIIVTGSANTLTIPVSLIITGGSPGLVTADPVSLSFNAGVGGSAAAPQTVRISTNTGAPVSFAVVAATGGGPVWLNVSPASATATPATPAELTVRADPAGLNAGLFNGAIVLFQGGTEILRVAVTFNVGGLPQLVLNPNALTFDYAGGDLPASKSVQVSSGQTGTFSVVSVNATWLSVSPTSGVTPNTLVVSVDPRGLTNGQYTGHIVVQSPGAQNSPQSVTVTLNVTSGNTLTLTPTTLSFSFQPGGTTPSPVPVSIGGIAGQNFSASTNQSWLRISATGGVTPATINVSVEPAGLVEGTHIGQVRIEASGATNSPQTIDVTLTVAGASVLTVTPDILIFNVDVGAGLQPPQSVSVTPTGGGSIQFTATLTSGSGWLQFTSSGIAPGGLQVSVNPAGLFQGTYTGSIRLDPVGVASGSRIVSVRLNVGTTSTLSVSPGSLSFVHQAGGLFPAAQTLLVSTSGASLNFAASASSNGNWLSVAPTSASTASTLSVSVNPTNLTPGTYTGSITITAAGATNSPVTVPIQLTVTTLQAVTLNVIPNSVSFSYQQGGSPPASQNLSVSTNTGTPVGYSVASSGGAWLTATPASGTTTGNVSVSVNPSGLAPGNYAGAITISAGGVQNSPVNIPINLTVTASTSLSASPGSLSFTHTGAGVPASQNVSVSSTGGSLSFTASSSASWLTVTPGSGSTPATLAIGVNPAALAAGTYNGAITINAPGGANLPQTINVTLVVQSSDPVINAVVNGASFAPGFFSPGVVVAIYGARIGPEEGVLFQATGGALPDVLADTRVLVDGSPATLIYVQARQVNAILPFALRGRTSAQIEIEYRGRRSNAIQIQLFEAAPALFAADGSGGGQAAALNQNGTLNSASNPADPDTFVSVFGTGGGDTDPVSADGRLATGAARLRLAVSARMGGLDAEVQYAGAAPGLANGAVQFNLRVPRGLRPGNHPVAVQVGRLTSQLGITIVVR